MVWSTAVIRERFYLILMINDVGKNITSISEVAFCLYMYCEWELIWQWHLFGLVNSCHECFILFWWLMREGGGHHELTNNGSKESDRCQNGWICVVCSVSKKEKNCAKANMRLNSTLGSPPCAVYIKRLTLIKQLIVNLK